MPLKVESLTPEVAFAVEYQGKIIPIFHYYQDDLYHQPVESWYTADKDEGVRTHQSRQPGVLGDYGYTNHDDRDDWYFCTDTLFKKMRSLPEFQDPNKNHSFQWEDSFILQTAINYGLVGFNEDYQYVDTTMIEEPIKSFTGGVIHPYDQPKQEVLNG
tara:strand:+ start:3605 stop:4078 length:474 start_codon:yes stop_codon:yes gene_type:complete